MRPPISASLWSQHTLCTWLNTCLGAKSTWPCDVVFTAVMTWLLHHQVCVDGFDGSTVRYVYGLPQVRSWSPGNDGGLGGLSQQWTISIWKRLKNAAGSVNVSLNARPVGTVVVVVGIG